MATNLDFITYDAQTKRAYLLDVFLGVKNISNIYMTIYAYLENTIKPPEKILDELYVKLNQIGKQAHEQEIEKHYHMIIQEIDHVQQQEQQDIFGEQGYLEALIDKI